MQRWFGLTLETSVELMRWTITEEQYDELMFKFYSNEEPDCVENDVS